MVRATRNFGLLGKRAASKADNTVVDLGNESGDEVSHTPDSKKLKTTLSFGSPNLEQRFTDHGLDTRPIIPGTPITGKLFQTSGAFALFQNMCMDSFITDMPKVFYPELIREFYANLTQDKFGNCISTVHDKKIRLNPPVLSSIIKFESLSETEVFTGKGYVGLPDFSVVDQFKHLLGLETFSDENPQPPSTTQVTPLAHLVFKICRSNVCPRGGSKSTFSCQDVTVVAMILAGKQFDLSNLVLKNMIAAVN